MPADSPIYQDYLRILREHGDDDFFRTAILPESKIMTEIKDSESRDPSGTRFSGEPGDFSSDTARVDRVNEILDEIHHEVRTAAESQEIVAPMETFCGVFPHGEFNALATGCDSGALLLVNYGAMALIYRLFKLQLLSHELKILDSDDNTEVSSLESEITEEQLVTQCAELVQAYLEYGSPTFSSRLPALGGARGSLLLLLTNATERFLVGHEYGHVVAGHITSCRTMRRACPRGDCSFISPDHADELVADSYGLRLLTSAEERQIRTPDEAKLLSYKFSAASAFFGMDRLVATVEAFIGCVPGSRMQRLNTHPGALFRYVAIRSLIESMGAKALLPDFDFQFNWFTSLIPKVIHHFESMSHPDEAVEQPSADR